MGLLNKGLLRVVWVIDTAPPTDAHATPTITDHW